MNKVFATAAEAIHDLTDGATLLVGGFGLSGNPECLIRAVHAKGVRGLDLVSNNAGTEGAALGAQVAMQLLQHRHGAPPWIAERYPTIAMLRRPLQHRIDAAAEPDQSG